MSGFCDRRDQIAIVFSIHTKVPIPPSTSVPPRRDGASRPLNENQADFTNRSNRCFCEA